MPLNVKVNAASVLARVLREGPDSLLSRGEAAALIASRVMVAHRVEKTARNRVAMMLDRACARGGAAHSSGLARLPDGRFMVDEIAHWAMINFPGEFSDLPHRPRTALASISDGFQIGNFSEYEATPRDAEGRLIVIEQLREKIRQIHADQQCAEIERKRKLNARLTEEKDK